MSKVNWAIAGVLMLALGGCGGRSVDSEPKRTPTSNDDDADAGSHEGNEGEESDSGSSSSEDDTSDDGSEDDVSEDDASDDVPSPDDPGSVATPGPDVTAPSMTGPIATSGPTAGIPAPGPSGAGGAIGVGPTGPSGPVMGFPVPGPTGPSGPIITPDGECYEYSSSGNGYCSTQYECPNQYKYTDCSRIGDRWQCGCSNGNTYMNYDISGVDEGSACDTMDQLCQSGQELTFDGPEQCERGDNGDTYSCQAVERCGPSADLGGGVTAWQVATENYAYCYQYDDVTSAMCDCGADGKYSSLILSGASFPSVCGTVFEACTAAEPIEFSEMEVCTEPYTSESGSSCSVQEECTRTGDLGGGLTGELRIYRGAYCQDAGDEWSCTCDSNGQSVGFNVAPSATAAATCSGAMDLCGKVQGVEPTGPLSCEFNSRNSSPESCGQTDQCGAAIEVDGVTVEVLGYINANCYRNGEGVWACDCYSGNNYESFEYMSTAAARDVCTAAMTNCQDLIEVDLSGGGGVIGRPIPLDVGGATGAADAPASTPTATAAP